MNALLLAVFGWLVPGGAYLLMRRYLQFAVFAFVVSATFAAGLVLQGGYRWPQPAELAGLDSFTALIFKAGAFAKLLAGGPYLVARLFNNSAFLSGRSAHEGHGDGGGSITTRAAVRRGPCVLLLCGDYARRWLAHVPDPRLKRSGKKPLGRATPKPRMRLDEHAYRFQIYGMATPRPSDRWTLRR